MWVALNKQLVCTLYPNFFPVNMIFSAVQPLGYNKICMGLNQPEGVHGDHCQLPDCDDCKQIRTSLSCQIDIEKTLRMFTRFHSYDFQMINFYFCFANEPSQ